MAFPSRLRTIEMITKLSTAQRNGKIQVASDENGLYYHELNVYIDSYFR
jgi:hypothetical protein